MIAAYSMNPIFTPIHAIIFKTRGDTSSATQHTGSLTG